MADFLAIKPRLQPPMVALIDGERADVIYSDEDPVLLTSEFFKHTPYDNGRNGAVPEGLRSILLEHWQSYKKFEYMTSQGFSPELLTRPGVVCLHTGPPEDDEAHDDDGDPELVSLTRRSNKSARSPMLDMDRFGAL